MQSLFGKVFKMSSKRTNKSKESTDENNIKQIIEMNLQLSNQMVGLKKKLSEAEADKTAIKNRCNQQSAECAKKDKEIKNLKIHLEKLESERFRNDLVVLDEGEILYIRLI